MFKLERPTVPSLFRASGFRHQGQESNFLPFLLVFLVAEPIHQLKDIVKGGCFVCSMTAFLLIHCMGRGSVEK